MSLMHWIVFRFLVKWTVFQVFHKAANLLNSHITYDNPEYIVFFLGSKAPAYPWKPWVEFVQFVPWTIEILFQPQSFSFRIIQRDIASESQCHCWQMQMWICDSLISSWMMPFVTMSTIWLLTLPFPWWYWMLSICSFFREWTSIPSLFSIFFFQFQ